MNATEWTKLLNTSKYSKPNEELYLYSQAFNSSNNTIHFRQSNQSALVINFYGPLDPGPYDLGHGFFAGPHWNMRAQKNLAVQIPSNTTWVSADRMGTNQAGAEVLFLVGYTEIRKDLFSDFLVGVSIPKGLFTVNLLWSKPGSGQNGPWALMDTIYGKFCNDSNELGMIEYWKKSVAEGSAEAHKLEPNHVVEGYGTPPTPEPSASILSTDAFK